ncbi:MAG TPA: putative toxin-antitoxin system toxin component, PIN family [Tepidisphaeraceae bacterium]|nr:putative toxin-antitoxin system toxin component, PIN family [Tepidisphaeraceae bacterium]
MKVVFDTNVYIAEALKRHGPAHRAIEATAAARWRVYASDYIVDELLHVMAIELQLPAKEVADAAQRVEFRCQMVALPSSRHVVPRDPKDTPILQTALAANADYLVTQDEDLQVLDPYEKLRIVSLASYIRLLENEGLI